MYELIPYKAKPAPWNKGKLVGQKTPLKPQNIWGIRIHLQMNDNKRDLALFNLAIGSKLRGCDLVKTKVSDISQSDSIQRQAQIVQQKIQRAVKFEITEQTREALNDWIEFTQLKSWDYLFPSRIEKSPHLSTRQYARIVKGWITSIGLDPAICGIHTLRRTKVSIIYKRTKSLRALQLLLGHTALESTVRYLRIEVDDALDLSEKIEVREFWWRSTATLFSLVSISIRQLYDKILLKNSDADIRTFTRAPYFIGKLGSTSFNRSSCTQFSEKPLSQRVKIVFQQNLIN